MKLFKRSWLRKIWVALVVLAGISFLIGQVAIYVSYGIR